jgi:methyl-accepting chemotaxis protein
MGLNLFKFLRNWFRNLTISKRLVFSISLLMIVVVFGLVGMMIQTQRSASQGFQTRTKNLTGKLLEQQQTAFKDIESRLTENTMEFLQEKAKCLAELTAKSARVPLLTFEIDGLDSCCSQACEDSDAVLCYVSNAQGKITSTFRNENDKSLIDLIGRVNDKSVGDVADALRKTDKVISISADIAQDGQKMGEVVALLSKQGVIRQQQQMQSEVNKLEDAMASTINAEDQTLQADMRSGLNMNLLIGFVAGGVALLLGFGAAFWIAASIVKPLRRVAVLLKDIAHGEGDLTRRLEITSKDEIGELSHWFNTFVEKLHTIIIKVSHNTLSLAGSSEELSSTATLLAKGSEEVADQSTAVAAAAEQMVANMDSMAASSEEMSANVKVVAEAIDQMKVSISEVARNADQAASVAHNAATLAEKSNKKIETLGNAADDIGKVIEVIQDIAEQTNLLALNATIEAARAGEAGKGFAVVATEVKELAKQTANATEDIRKRIEGIQSSTSQTVQAVNEIGNTIQLINDVSKTIASTVDVQNVTTKEIAENIAQTSLAVQDVARGIVESATVSREITKNIVAVNQAVRQSSAGVSKTMDAGHELANLADELQTLMSQFKVNDNCTTAA